MTINMTQPRMAEAAKRVKKILRDMGYATMHTKCLDLTAKLCGFENWRSYCEREFAPLSSLDGQLSEEEFLARDAFQMKVLEDAGFGRGCQGVAGSRESDGFVEQNGRGLRRPFWLTASAGLNPPALVWKIPPERAVH